MDNSIKICPLLSSNGCQTECVEHKCQFFREVYSTENINQPADCILALLPRMVKGVLRV